MLPSGASVEQRKVSIQTVCISAQKPVYKCYQQTETGVRLVLTFLVYKTKRKINLQFSQECTDKTQILFISI